MKRDEQFTIEELSTLESPVRLSADVKPISDTPLSSITMPGAIYKDYGERKFRLMREAKERIKGILLDMDAWNVLWQVDGRRTVSEIADNLMLPLDVVVYHVECLKLMAIICPLGAIYLPEFILDKTEKKVPSKKRRRSDSGQSKASGK